MKIFNAIQIAALVAAGPTLIPLLKAATFTGATPLFWLSLVIYAILFIWTVIAFADSFEKS